MLAKAGEGDRAIKTKMVQLSLSMFSFSSVLILYPSSQNIYSLANAKAERLKEDDYQLLFVLHTVVLL